MSATFAIAKRTLYKFMRTPQLVVVGTIQGAMFLLIFRYVFGGAISESSVPYVDFLVPGFITTTVLFAGTATAAGVAEDVEQGFLDRLRSLPIPRGSVLAGRAIAETILLAWMLAVTAAIGFAVGFRLHGSLLEALGAFGLCLLFGFAFSWLFMMLGLFAGNAQAAQGMSLLVFPLTFVSSAYVRTDTMPSWMSWVAEHQPITAMVDAVRSLTLGDRSAEVLGHASGHYLLPALVWSAVIVAAFAPVAVARARRG
ncbi:MAG TPA: ABC transporter permease [Acidimicrobiales bacterium]|nr:ABC transporter permease [Acidimicrobiales bacterium]